MANELTIKKSAPAIVEEAQSFTIKDAKDMGKASELLSRMNKGLDAVVAYKEKKTKPLNEALKVIRAETKPIEALLESGIAALRRTMTNYQTEQTAIADAEAKKIEDRIGPGRGKLGLNTAVAKIDEIDRPESSIIADSGMVKFKPNHTFEVTDKMQLPAEYLLANEVAIRAAMKAGTKLPGVRYFTEQIPVNSR